MIEQHRKDNELRRAVAYLRFAIVDATGQRAALARHICERRANELGAILEEVYTDIGSGWTDDREQLRKLLADLTETSGISFVIVPEHSTIARDMQLYGRIAWKIEQAGARLMVATVPLENYPGIAPSQLSVLHAVADWATTTPRPERLMDEGEQPDSSPSTEVEDE